MGAQWCESFQVYPSVANMLQGVWSQIDADWTISTVKPASGVQGMHCSGVLSAWPAMRRIFREAVVTAGVAFRFWVSNLPTNEGAVGAMMLSTFLDVAANVQVSFVLGTNGAIVCYGGGDYQAGAGNLNHATLLTRSNPCIIPAAYNHIECKVSPGNPGTIECRVNGVTVINFVGDTLGHNEVGQWAVGGAATVNGVADMYYGDLHAWDTLATPGPQDFVGNSSVRTRAFNADTATAGWTLSSGSVGYVLLSDNSDATYIEADTVGLESAFKAGNFDADVVAVVYQQANFRGLKLDAGDCDITPGFVSSGVTAAGTVAIMTPGETWFSSVSATDPATGVPWTITGAQAAAVEFTRTL